MWQNWCYYYSSLKLMCWYFSSLKLRFCLDIVGSSNFCFGRDGYDPAILNFNQWFSSFRAPKNHLGSFLRMQIPGLHSQWSWLSTTGVGYQEPSFVKCLTWGFQIHIKGKEQYGELLRSHTPTSTIISSLLISLLSLAPPFYLFFFKKNIIIFFLDYLEHIIDIRYFHS